MDRPNSRALTREVTPRAEPERMAAFHHDATFAIGKADPENRLSAVAQKRPFR